MHAFRRLLTAVLAVALVPLAGTTASADPAPIVVELDPGLMNIEVAGGGLAIRFDVRAWMRDAATGNDPTEWPPSMFLAKFESPGVLAPVVELCTDHPNDGSGAYSCDDEFAVTDAASVVADVQAHGYRMRLDANAAHGAVARNGHSAVGPAITSPFPQPGPLTADDPKYTALDITPQTSDLNILATPPKFKPNIRTRSPGGQELNGVRARFYTAQWSFICEGVSAGAGQLNACITPNYPGSGYANITNDQSASLYLFGYRVVVGRECPLTPPVTVQPPIVQVPCYQYFVGGGSVKI